MACKPTFSMLPGSVLFIVLYIVLYAASVRAADPDPPKLLFNGFGTLGMVHSSEDLADFTSSTFKPDGAGYSKSWSADVDSLIAGQVTADFTPRLLAVVQVISEQNYDNTYTPHVEWANIKYQLTPDFSVRAGRTVLPVFLLFDSRKVGFTNPWVRPPPEVYRLVPITNNDGVDVSYSLRLGEVNNTVQIYYGSTKVKLTDNNGTASASNLRGITYKAEYGPLTTQLAYMKTRLTTAAINLRFDKFRQFGPQGISIADKYASNDKPITVIGLGVGYDPGEWFVMGEWDDFDSHSFQGKRKAWYVSSGYRFNTFTPYATYARATADNLSDPGLTISALPAFQAGPATDLNTALNALLRRKYVQETVSVGIRWDFRKNADLKLQFDHSDIGAGSNGTLINPQPGFQPGGSFNVFSASVEFVF